jgi:hypothetical protein
VAAIHDLVTAAGGTMDATIATGDEDMDMGQEPMEEKRRMGRSRETNPDGDRPMEEAMVRRMIAKIVKETLQGN